MPQTTHSQSKLWGLPQGKRGFLPPGFQTTWSRWQNQQLSEPQPSLLTCSATPHRPRIHACALPSAPGHPGRTSSPRGTRPQFGLSGWDQLAAPSSVLPLLCQAQPRERGSPRGRGYPTKAWPAERAHDLCPFGAGLSASRTILRPFGDPNRTRRSPGTVCGSFPLESISVL